MQHFREGRITQHLVRYRNKLIHEMTFLKNFIHGITLQEGIKQKHKGFSQVHAIELKGLRSLDRYEHCGHFQVMSGLYPFNNFDFSV